MSPLEQLAHKVETRATLEQALETLLDGLAERVKATSNDQNVQRLAREIRIVAPNLVKAVLGKRA